MYLFMVVLRHHWNSSMVWLNERLRCTTSISTTFTQVSFSFFFYIVIEINYWIKCVCATLVGDAPYAKEEFSKSFFANCLFVGGNMRKAVNDGRAGYFILYNTIVFERSFIINNCNLTIIFISLYSCFFVANSKSTNEQKAIWENHQGHWNFLINFWSRYSCFNRIEFLSMLHW